MKYFLKSALASIIILSFQGCATQANFINKYNSWVGYNIKHLIAQIGYPDSTYILSNKNKVYVYDRSRIYSMPTMMPMMGGWGMGGMGMGWGMGGFHPGWGMGMGIQNQVIQETCKLFLETNKKGIIVKWGSRGNHCVL